MGASEEVGLTRLLTTLQSCASHYHTTWEKPVSGKTITRDELADLIERHARALARAVRRGPGLSDVVPADERATGGSADGAAGADVLAEDQGASGGGAQAGAGGAWTKFGELPDQTYAWPEGTEHYEPFEVWERADGRGRVRVGLGRAVDRGIYYGKERGYWLAFEMVNGRKRRPIVVFNEADDFETSADLVAIIKGKGEGGRSMFAPGDELPVAYDGMQVEIFRDRINGPQAFNRLAVIARGGDRQAMCEHASLQLGLRS